MGKHPHGRGEDRPDGAPDSVKLETPPRAWGRLVRKASGISNIRNTPTGVGKTSLGFTGNLDE